MNNSQKKLAIKSAEIFTNLSQKQVVIQKDLPVPLYIFDISKLVDRNEIVQLVYDYRDKFPVSRTSTIKGWHSDYFAHTNFIDTRSEKLLSTIKNIAEKIINRGYAENVRANIFNVWYNILNKGDKIHPHHHLPDGLIDTNQYSIVYYPKTQDDMSPIIFENNFEILPKNDMLLLFPSYLVHSVDELTTTEDRISISANIALAGKEKIDKNQRDV